MQKHRCFLTSAHTFLVPPKLSQGTPYHMHKPHRTASISTSPCPSQLFNCFLRKLGL